MKRLTSNTPLTEFEAMNMSATNLYARLKEYENTGLEPEEVAYFLGTTMSVKDAKAQYAEHKKRHDEYMAWKNAEAEGRLLILPCKVGDTVWVNVPNMQGSDNIRIFKATVINFLFDKLGTLVYCEYRNYGYCSCYGRIGKTVFLTRAEAEAALRGGADG